MKIRSFSIGLFILILLSSSVLTGCLRRKNFEPSGASLPPINLSMFGLFDSEEIYQPAIQTFRTQSGGRQINVTYKKFIGPEEYLDLIINELAEGEGPDIFMMHNSWFPKHYKKLTPAPSSIVTPEVFRNLFVEVAANDLIIPDENGVEQVWGLPLYVDTLALYYNKDHLEDAIPSQGKPSSTWTGIQNDVSLLNREDQSFERFERSGIALGRSDNILRAYDILLSMMLQYKVDFYNEDLSKVAFANDPNAIAALNMFTSFALPSQKNYSWNRFLADPESGGKEITTFASGKTSMIMGYSYAYQDIVDEINRLKSLGEKTVDPNVIRVQETPQVFDPETSAETREAYASYFVPVVSRTSEYPEEAWSFLTNLVSEDFLMEYNKETHRPSALRSLITDQMADPIYGVFAAQVGYANSVPVADPQAYESIFLAGVDKIIDTFRTEDVLKSIADEIQSLIPTSGIKPTVVLTE